MPYNGINDKNIPSYVKKVSDKLKTGWVSVFNKAYDKYGEKKAFLMANTWLKKQLPQDRKNFVKRSSISFELDTTGGFIKRSEEGDDYITFVLNSNKPHRDGTVFDEGMLKDWADYINKNPTLVGDVDHIFYDKVLNSRLSDEQVRQVLKSKKGIAKMVQAIYDKGKLWVRAIIDKRYKKVIQKAKGVSAEAWHNQSEGNIIKKGELLGFSFNVNTTPADYHAGVVS